MITWLPSLLSAMHQYTPEAVILVVSLLAVLITVFSFLKDCGETLVRLIHGHPPIAREGVDDTVSHGYDRS